MTDQQLAIALVQAGLLTPQQIHAAAQKRAGGKSMAQVLVEAGWVSAQQIARIDPAASVVPSNGASSNGASANGGAEKNGHSSAIVPATAAPPLVQAVQVGMGQDGALQLNDSGVVLEGEGEGIEDEMMGETVRLVNQLLKQAVAMRASDLHLEPQDDGLLPRFRVDGQLRPGKLVPRETQASIISRLKLMGRMDITETRLSQDGRFRATVGGRRFDFRVSTLPGVHGEKAVLRLLDPSALVTDLTRLGFADDTRNTFEEMLRRSHGMILVTGPTGSGKTTTLYAALATTRDSTKNVVTVEDPVEYEMKGIMQCGVNSEIGNTFAARLRSILRQDPDVILVGEIRDTETAEMAVRAALTGHLVLSTLHTNSAVAAVTRLQDMGVAPFLIASCLAGVVAQRLVRLICRNCREPLPPDSSELEIALKQWNLPPGTPLYHGAGCAECNGTGLRGRLALLEVLTVEREMRRAIMEKADADTLHRLALSNGMKTLYQDGIEKLQRGLTTTEEVARAFFGTEDIDSGSPTAEEPVAADASSS